MSVFEEIKKALEKAVANQGSLVMYNMCDICPKCGGNLELREDGYEYCDSCDYNTRNN